MKPLRIAFAAKQRSGKDAAAEFILRFHQGSIKKFADPLYDLMYMIQDRLSLPKEKDRLLLQVLGTDWGRERNPNIWLDALFNEIEKDKNSRDAIIITDARFNNEFEACKQHGFTLVKISARDDVRLARGADTRPHASEVDMDEYTAYDYVIENNGSLESFHDKLIDMLADLNRE